MAVLDADEVAAGQKWSQILAGLLWKSLCLEDFIAILENVCSWNESVRICQQIYAKIKYHKYFSHFPSFAKWTYQFVTVSTLGHFYLSRYLQPFATICTKIYGNGKNCHNFLKNSKELKRNGKRNVLSLHMWHKFKWIWVFRTFFQISHHLAAVSCNFMDIYLNGNQDRLANFTSSGNDR